MHISAAYGCGDGREVEEWLHTSEIVGSVPPLRLYSTGLENSQLFFEFRASDPKNNLAILWAEFLFLHFQCKFVQIALASPLELCRSSQGTTHRWRWLW